MPGRALQHLAAHRRVRAGVAEHPRPHRREPPLGVAADGVVHRDRVALGVQPHRLLAAQRQLHRAAGDVRQQRGLRLDRHVLLAAEGAAVGHQLDVDPLLGDAEEARRPGGGRRRCPGPA